MRTWFWIAGLVIAAATSSSVDAQRGSRTNSITPQALARWWDASHVSPPAPPLVTHAEVVERLESLTAAHPKLFTMERIGESVEGRSINHVRAGSGRTGVLLWSQMHGDEPTATSALFDIFHYFASRPDDPAVRRILSELTLHVVPMLNPDGAERFQRRNAQSIDINRDALRLQTPEGRALKALRDRLEPKVGFNLHNQGWSTGVGDPPKPASISLLSVAYDEARTENDGRRLTKKLSAVIRDAIEPFASGQIGRYDDSFEMRAFGDNITLWGTPVVLIETGPWPAEDPDPHLIRLNFVAIMSALDALATGGVDRADPERYESLPMNDSGLLHTLIRNATVINGAGVPPYIADIGISGSRRVEVRDGKRTMRVATSITDMGDLRKAGALREIDASGLTAVPDRGYEVGATVDLPHWKDTVEHPIATGEQPRLALLRQVDGGRYRVEMVLSEPAARPATGR